MKYKCKCGDISYITFDNFKQGKRCKKCRKILSNQIQKLDYDYVCNYFLKNNCELLEDNYINNHTLMKYKCSCGNITYTTFHNFQKSNLCKVCTGQERPSNEIINECFQKRGFVLLENNYINCQSKTLKYQCPNGHINFVSWNNFSRGKGCPNCIESRGEKVIESYLNDNNYNFENEYKFMDCRNILPLRFDFAIFNDGNLKCLIEYDGRQHFNCEEHFGGETKFNKLKRNDQIKNKYCQQNNIPLLRIPYWEFDNIENILNDFLSNFN